MFDKTATIKEMFIYINKQLDLVDWYLSDENKHLPKKLIDENVEGLRNQAFGVVNFIYTTLGYNSNHVDYRGIKIPKDYLEYFEKLNNK